MNLQNIPRFLLSAIGSGQGKTTVTAALLGAFCTKGIRVQSYKCGPDYIDPMFHESITGTPCYHTDPFFSDEAEMKQLVVKKSRSAQLTILEGAMGFYDGIGGTEQASAYTVSEYLDTPVVLVVSPQGVGCSLAAICRGFQQFRMPNAICGVILNQIRPEMYDYYREILQRETGLSVYGYLPALPQTRLESRHLGLMTAKEVTSLEEKLQLLSKTALKTVHLDALTIGKIWRYWNSTAQKSYRFHLLQIRVCQMIWTGCILVVAIQSFTCRSSPVTRLFWKIFGK